MVHYETSKITGRTFNIFNIVRIKNIKQAVRYCKNGVYPVDMEFGENDSLIFIFDRDETKDVYDLWCKYELE